MHQQEKTLKRGLSARHIRFMALGSAIGTGLFYGSASAIQMAGPAVLLAYLIGGAAVFMVMRALGEMAVHNPVSGSFGQYASTYLGPMAGFILGWTGLVVPAKTPAAIVNRLNKAAAFALEQNRPYLESSGYVLIGGMPQQMEERIATELKTVTPLLAKIMKTP